MMDDLIKKDLLAHKIYSSWQFIKYTEKNIDIVHYCADTINNLVDKMEMKTIRWQQDIVSDFVDDVTKDGKKVKRLSITKENSPMYELRVVGEKVDPWFLFDGKEGFKAVHEYLVNGGKSCMAGFVLKNTLSDNGGVTRGICKMDTENVSVEIIDFSNEAQLNMYTKKELIGLV